MFVSLIRLALPATAIALATTSPLHAEDNPQVFVESVYETGWDVISTDRAVRRETLTAGFAKAIKADLKRGNEARLEYNPLVGTETEDASDITVEVTEETDDTVKADVGFKNAGADGEVAFVLAKTGKGLRLDDIVLADRGSVREQLAAAPAGADGVKDITIKSDGPTDNGRDRDKKMKAVKLKKDKDKDKEKSAE